MRYIVTLTIIFVCALTVANVYAEQLGSKQNPYPVYYGWQGSGYYIFTTKNFTTGFVSDVCQLNSISMKLTGNTLLHPYDPNQIAQCLSKVPEFGSLAVTILIISIIGVLIISRRISCKIP